MDGMGQDGELHGHIVIRDFRNIFIDEVKVAEKSIIIIKFEADNNTVVILYKKQQKS